MERSMEYVGDEMWRMLFQIWVGESKKKTRINKCRSENTICNFG